MILCFHDIAARPKNEWVITPKQFEEVLSLLELEKTNLPIEIHFDDARLGVYKYAAPILRQHISAGKIHPVIFVVPNWVEHYVPPTEAYSEFLSWKQLNELHTIGFEIGSHSMNHRNLLFESDQNLGRQLLESKHIIQNQINCIVTKFSYPYGACDQRVITETTKYYKSAYQLNHYPEDSYWTVKRELVLIRN